MKILYWIFLIILILGGVSMGIYGFWGYSLFELVPHKYLRNGFTLDQLLHILVGISAIIVLLSNFHIKFTFKPKDS